MSSSTSISSNKLKSSNIKSQNILLNKKRETENKPSNKKIKKKIKKKKIENTSIETKKTASIKKKKVTENIISLDEKEEDIHSPEKEKKEKVDKKKRKLKNVQKLDKFNTKETSSSNNSNENKEKSSSSSKETIKTLPKIQDIKSKSLEKVEKKETKPTFEQKFDDLKKYVEDEFGHLKNQLNQLKQQNLKFGLKLEIVNQANIHQDKKIEYLNSKISALLNSYKVLYFRKLCNLIMEKIISMHHTHLAKTKEKFGGEKKKFSIIEAKKEIKKIPKLKINLLID